MAAGATVLPAPTASSVSVPLEPGDAPCVRDLLLEHFRGADIEVEGKLGRCSKDRFTAGVTAEQFALLEARLQESLQDVPSGADSDATPAHAALGLLTMSTGAGPELQVTLDRFHVFEEEGGGCPQDLSRSGRRKSKAPQTVRASFVCDATSSASSSLPLPLPRPGLAPYEVLRKIRLSDSFVACTTGDQAQAARTPMEAAKLERDAALGSPVSLRVSFSRETEMPKAAVESAIIYERLKRRREWEARFWKIALTHVTDDDGREAFEVEVELCMKAVHARLDAAGSEHLADEALLVTREFVAVLRQLAAWSSEVPCPSVVRKRRRLEEARAADPYLKKAMEAPEVVSELHRRVSSGRDGLHEAKEELCQALRARCPAGVVDEAALMRFAGQQVARALRKVTSGTGEEDDATVASLAPALTPCAITGLQSEGGCDQTNSL